jgi:transposase InsO family protein
VVDFVQQWSSRTGIAVTRFINWLEIGSSKYYNWQSRYGKVNEHNGLIPRDFWLDDWEKQAIIRFSLKHPLEGYRRLTFMMLDRDIVAVSPSSVYRVLKKADLLRRWKGTPSRKGKGFVQPLRPHAHWHIDVAYVNICSTFYYLCTILDGFSRYIVHWELREAMTEQDVEIILQRAREKFPEAQPRIISDNGPQFIAKDFKEFIRVAGMTHVRTSPFYPQSNGKLERYHKTIKSECIRPGVALSLDEARSQIAGYIAYYNDERLNSAIGYIAPKDKLEGREEQIFKDRDRKLEAARAARKLKRCHQTTRENAAPLVADRGRADKVKPPAGALRDPVGSAPIC